MNYKLTQPTISWKFQCSIISMFMALRGHFHRFSTDFWFNYTFIKKIKKAHLSHFPSVARARSVCSIAACLWSLRLPSLLFSALDKPWLYPPLHPPLHLPLHQQQHPLGRMQLPQKMAMDLKIPPLYRPLHPPLHQILRLPSYVVWRLVVYSLAGVGPLMTMIVSMLLGCNRSEPRVEQESKKVEEIACC